MHLSVKKYEYGIFHQNAVEKKYKLAENRNTYVRYYYVQRMTIIYTVYTL